jgi:hypothetical protein
MPQMVQRSLQNLTRCPAWQQSGPGVCVKLHAELHGLPADYTAGLLGLLLGALAPLAGKEVTLEIWPPQTLMGASEVQQLGITLGSSLKQLSLQHCDLSADFWPAVWAHLPGLQQLEIQGRRDATISAHELTSFCSQAPRPLQLSLDEDLYNEVGGELEEQCRVLGEPKVTVICDL